MVDTEDKSVRLEARSTAKGGQGRDHVAPDVNHRFKISDEAFRYLAIQQGGINDLADNRAEWERAYHDAMHDTYRSIKPYLPARTNRVLDVGSGLGGIDVLLNKHYWNELEVCAVDGLSDEPIVNLHANTFNSERVTREFLKANGVRRVSYYAPTALPTPSPYMLIVSFASWCFHYPPGHYLHFVRQSLRPGGTLIVDVRRERPKWREALDTRFQFLDCVWRGKKTDRLVYVG